MHKPICSVAYRPVSIPPTPNETELNAISFSTQSMASALLWQRYPIAQNSHQDTQGNDNEQHVDWRGSNSKTKRVTAWLMASLGMLYFLIEIWKG